MKTLTIYLIKYPLMQFVILIMSIIIMRITLVGSIAYCEGMGNWAQNMSYETNPAYEDKTSTEYAKYNLWKTYYDSGEYVNWKTYYERTCLEAEIAMKNAAILQKNQEEANTVFKFLEVPEVVKAFNYDLIKVLEAQTFVSTCHPTVLKVINDLIKLKDIIEPENYLALIRETWIKHCNTTLLSNKEICLNLDLLVAHSNKHPLIIQMAACYILESAINFELKGKNIYIERQNEIFRATVENYMKQPVNAFNKLMVSKPKIYSLTSLLKKEAFISGCDINLQAVIGELSTIGIKIRELKETCTFADPQVQQILAKLEIGNETDILTVFSLIKTTNNPIIFDLYCCMQLEILVEFEKNFTETEIEKHYDNLRIQAIKDLNIMPKKL